MDSGDFELCIHIFKILTTTNAKITVDDKHILGVESLGFAVNIYLNVSSYCLFTLHSRIQTWLKYCKRVFEKGRAACFGCR